MDFRNVRSYCLFPDRVKDDYLANRVLRDGMRAQRRAAKATKIVDDTLREKSSLPSDMHLVAESKEDVLAATLLRLQPSQSSEERQSSARDSIIDEDIFSSKDGAAFAATPSTSGASSSSSSSMAGPSPLSTKDRSKMALHGIVSKHRLESRQSKASPLKKGIGVILKKDKTAAATKPSSTVTSSSSTEATKDAAEPPSSETKVVRDEKEEEKQEPQQGTKRKSEAGVAESGVEEDGTVTGSKLVKKSPGLSLCAYESSSSADSE